MSLAQVLLPCWGGASGTLPLEETDSGEEEDSGLCVVLAVSGQVLGLVVHGIILEIVISLEYLNQAFLVNYFENCLTTSTGESKYILKPCFLFLRVIKCGRVWWVWLMSWKLSGKGWSLCLPLKAF